MENAVLRYLDEHKQEISKTLSELIQIDSQNQGMPNTANEGEAQNYVYEHMKKLGLEPKKLAFDQNKCRPNVYGTLKGVGNGNSLLMNAHIDTVCVTDPDAWTLPPLAGIIKDGKVHGRGASDDKMAITAMLYAVKSLQECGIKLKGDVYLLSSVGEESGEGGTIGAGPAVEHMPKPSFAIVSEATCMEMDIESSSMTYFEVIVKGKAAHACGRNQALFPQMHDVPSGSDVGVDALSKALPIIDMLYRLEQDWCVNNKYKVWGAGGIPTHDMKGLGVFNVNPSKIEGGGYLYSLMNSVKITYSLHYPVSMTIEEITSEIKRCVNAVASTDSWLRENPPEVRMPVYTNWPGFKTDINEPGLQTLRSVYKRVLGKEAIVTANKSVMDTSFIRKAGIPVVGFGPGGVETNQHGVNEYCDLEELMKSIKVYACMMMEWCGLADN